MVAKGTRVQIKRSRIYGVNGHRGRITRKTPERISGRLYYSVKLTGGQFAGSALRFLESEMEIV